MTTFTPSPALLELREEIDAVDQRLAQILCQRLEMIHRAAPLKPTRDTVRLEDRIEDIIEKVIPVADRYEGIDRAYLETVFRFIIEESIARETVLWDKIYAGRS